MERGAIHTRVICGYHMGCREGSLHMVPLEPSVSFKSMLGKTWVGPEAKLGHNLDLGLGETPT